MMREIKFRAWDKKYKEMLGVLEIRRDRILCSDASLRDRNRITLLEFTGLKDKIGQEIYEGDILDYSWAVRFYDGHFVLCNPIEEEAEHAAKEQFCSLSVKEARITGNIFEGEQYIPLYNPSSEGKLYTIVINDQIFFCPCKCGVFLRTPEKSWPNRYFCSKCGAEYEHELGTNAITIFKP